MKPTRLVFAMAALFVLFRGSAIAHPASGIAVDARGRVFFADTGRGVWRIDPGGKLTLVSASAMHWMTIDRAGAFADAPERFGRLTPPGEKPTLIFCSDFPCVIGPDGNLYYAKMHGLTILRRTPAGDESVLASRERFGYAADRPIGVNGMTAGKDGTVYLVSLDSLNRTVGTGEHALHAVRQDGTIRTIAKNFIRQTLPEGERPPEVRPQYCRGMAVDDDGKVYIAATGGRSVLKIQPSGESAVLLRADKPWSPTGVEVFRGETYVLEYDAETPVQGRDWPPRVRKVGRDGAVTTLATVRRGSDATPAD